MNDIDEATVVDEWVFVRSTWFIARRSYAWNGQSMVTDHFDPIDSTCFKRRVYKQMERDAICFPESGIAGSLRSPIPPSFYWFFYR